MRVLLLYHPLALDHTHVNQWPAAFKIDTGMPYRRGYLKQSFYFVFIQFRGGIFNFFASSNRDVLFIYYFCNTGRLQKSFGLTFTSRKIHQHHHHSTCYIVSFLHRCIYTLQHMPEDDNFYLVCRQNQSLTLPLHCNTYLTERLDHKRLFLCVLSTFSTCHRRAYLLLVLSPVFQAAVTRLHFKSFYIETTHSFSLETLNDIA